MSLNRQVIEGAFGILIQRWGIFWRPFKVSMEHRGIAIRVTCKLRNICIFQRIMTIDSHSVPGFERETDHQNDDDKSVNIQFTDDPPLQSKNGYRSDLEKSTHTDKWTETIKNNNLTRPTFSKYSRTIICK
jgi:hypothetical protein